MAAIDWTKGDTARLLSSIIGAFDITKSDVNELPYVTRQIKVTGAGNLAVVWADGSTTTEAVAADTFYDWRIKQVLSTGTSATGIRGYR